MLNCFTIALLMFFLTGCTGASRNVVLKTGAERPADSRVLVSTPAQSVQSAQSAEPAHPAKPLKPTTAAAVSLPGVVFGKTDFTGLLKTTYVRLLIVDRDDPLKKYVFSVGDRASSSLLPWVRESRVIEPGHFLFELPPGKYKIIQLAIPAGSALAEENMELDFNVQAGMATYLGSLQVEGTRERVKFGGIPLIRPGFVYSLAVIDDYDSAVSAVTAMIPKGLRLRKELLRVVVLAPDGVPTDGVFRWHQAD